MDERDITEELREHAKAEAIEWDIEHYDHVAWRAAEEIEELRRKVVASILDLEDALDAASTLQEIARAEQDAGKVLEVQMRINEIQRRIKELETA